MLRLVFSIIGGIAVLICVLIYTFTGMNSEEQVNGKKVSSWWDHWHQLHYKEVFVPHSDTQEWSLSTKYGSVHISANEKDKEMNQMASEARDAVSDAGSGESLFYTLIAFGFIFISVVLINRRRIIKKHPYFLKILLMVLPIFILGVVFGSIQDAARGSERAEKVFLQLKK